MAVVNGYVDWAMMIYPGNKNKVYSNVNSGEYFVFHSMEGNNMAAAYSRLQNMSIQSSWMFSTDKNGVLYQHYPVTASCWASGNYKINTSSWSHELVGFAGEPINNKQMETVQALIKEWEVYTGRKAERGKTIFEHKEVAQWIVPNAGPTSCPSSRYDRLWRKMAEGEEMELTEQLKALNEAVMKREDLRRVASGDYQNLLKAWEVLKAAGLL